MSRSSEKRVAGSEHGVRAIVKIGYVDILVRDTKSATKLIELLSECAEVHDELYRDKLVLEERALRLEMKIVPAGTVLMRKRPDGEEEPVSEVPTRRALPNPTLRLQQ